MHAYSDIVVVGAGPAGLCFARAMEGSGLSVSLIERQPAAVLAAPPDDGREIALTHRSRSLLTSLGVWRHLRTDEIGVLRDARVLDDATRTQLWFRHQDGGRAELGWLVGNHALRRAAYLEATSGAQVRLHTGIEASGLRRVDGHVELDLGDGSRLRTRLLIAADSRFSALRRAAGIAADLHDYGKTMLVLRMRHEVPHEGVAWEWFARGQTLALLPLAEPHTSSVVVTLAPAAMQTLLALDDAALEAELAARFRHRLGTMRVAGPRCTYPLVGVYARAFVADQFALLGDAAVGMHPVTAHGFNFGLLGAATLARELRAAHAAGQPFWAREPLCRYQRAHRLATWPLYRATQALATLFTDDRAPARLLRRMSLDLGARLTPFRRWVAAGLTDEAPSPAPWCQIAAALRPSRPTHSPG
ncbi:MAG: 5-demethoxyubiquinol-8 5-hydroxylase UbiM [Fulvimonas sp.]|nr:5-demethoxyubiquinol-8 5-hydroxylase UbiM [Fulvimonas sp.]